MWQRRGALVEGIHTIQNSLIDSQFSYLQYFFTWFFALLLIVYLNSDLFLPPQWQINSCLLQFSLEIKCNHVNQLLLTCRTTLQRHGFLCSFASNTGFKYEQKDEEASLLLRRLEPHQTLEGTGWFLSLLLSLSLPCCVFACFWQGQTDMCLLQLHIFIVFFLGHWPGQWAECVCELELCVSV